MVEDLAPLWVPQHDYMPPEDRSVIRALRASPGVVGWDDFVSAATEPPSWNIDVGPGRAVIDGSTNPWTQGSYIVYSPSSVRVPVQPSHPTQNRLDVLVAHVHDQDNSTEQGYSWAREIVTGQPGSGVPPSIPSNSLPLRGLNIPAGATAVRPEHLITFWPWWVNNDLRRPAGPVLIHIHDYKEGNWWTFRHYFDLQIPPAWRSLALWDFPVVQETHWNVYMYNRHTSFHGGTLTAHTRAQGTPGGRVMARTIAAPQWATAHMGFSFMERFDPGDPPRFDLMFQSQYADNYYESEYDTKIYPLSCTTHRIWGDTIQW